ncbi:MAG: NUDIX domain-containing protein [Elusimicrobiaceae bacterium]|nr:NUDIX domain-containing protein [Elusimicrobiaceae bacterium]MBQ6224474.1 NUDIX domain-containing protein [Campylobacter sp.]
MFAEFSCGGVILEKNKVLLVQVKSMKGRKIWTFPKGHIEQGETPRQAALREVLEETGYKASIVKPLLKVRYAFTLKGRYVRKVVQWYLMKKLGRIGKHDPSEILAINWVSINKAKEMVEYPSDKRLLELVEEESNITKDLTEVL